MALQTSNPYPANPGANDRPTRPGGPSEARIIDLVDTRRQASLRYNQALFGKLQRWYESYRGVWSGRIAQFRNNVSIPFTFAMIQSDVARKVQTLFGSSPIVSFDGFAPEDAPRAKKNEVLISAQMKDCDSLVKGVDLLLQASISGTAVLRYGWKNVTRRTRMTQLEQVAPGYHVPVVRERNATVFDGPTWDPVDRLDFWQQPAKNHIEDMGWCIHRYYADLDDLLDDAHGENPYFDLDALMRLKQSPMDSQTQTEFGRRRVIYRNEYDYQARANELFAKPVEIWEMHGLVPSEFSVNGIRDRCIAIGNSRVVLKNREAPMGPGVKPFLSYSPMPDPFSFDGTSKAEIAFGPQQTANRLTNQKLDALDIMIDPPIVASSNVGINTQSLFTRAGRVILVDGPADESSIRQMTLNMQGVQAAYTEVGAQFGFMQLGTGETESLLGQTGGADRETARGFMGRQENALTRLGMESRLADNMIEKLADAFRMMDRRWLSRPHEMKIIGSLATTDPDTGMPYAEIDRTISDDDLIPDYRARAVGATQMIGRGVRQQNFITLVQAMSSNPAMMQLVNWGAMAREGFELFDFRNVADLLVQKPLAVNQPEGAVPGPGQAPAPAGGIPLQHLSPDVLGQLMQTANPAPMQQAQ